MNITFKKLIAIGTAVVALTTSAGTVQRKTDFLNDVELKTAGNSHGSAGQTEDSAWNYFIVPNYLRYYNKETQSLDYRALLSKGNLVPLPCSNMTFALLERDSDNRGQTFSHYQVSADNVMLYWNYFGDARGEFDQSAVVMMYTVPKRGAYSLSGPLAVLSNHQRTVDGAILAIVAYHSKDSVFEPRFVQTLNSEILKGEARQVAALDAVDSLQDMELAAGDQLVFIFGSARKNHNGLTVIDSDVRIESSALPRTQPIGDEEIILSRLDFSSPDLRDVKRSLSAGNVDEAFTNYKKVLAMRTLKLPEVKGAVGCWIHNYANADRLLEGELSTGHYGAPGVTTYTIGKPGNVDWFKVPEDGYVTILRDITTMHWTNKLAEAYAKTGDKRYVDAYLGYWCDFTTNWYRDFNENMRDPEFRGLLNGSVQWALRSRLYIAWRMDVLKTGLKLILRRAASHDKLRDIDNDQLAMVMKHLYDKEFPAAMRFLEGGGGVPNQQAHLAGAMFFHGVFLHDMKGAGAWQEASLSSTLDKGGYLPDGTDMEQSFNYNKGLPVTLDGYITLANALLPPSNEPAWLPEVRKRVKYRTYFMQSIVMPMSGQPMCGNNNTWGEYDKDKKFLPGLEEELPLTKVIKNKFYGADTAPDPGFRSIFFPYGGYVAVRGNWSADALYAFMKVSRPGRGHMQNENNAVQFSALGRQLLVKSSHNPYSPDKTWKDYGHSSVSCSSVAVDGYGNSLSGSKPPSSYTTPLNYRFLDGEVFSFAEGVHDGHYAGYNFLDPANKENLIIDDVSHQRQLFLLRGQNMMIVTDIVRSEKEHRFTQTWNFPPDFQKDEVMAKDGVISTRRPEDVNLTMYQFTDGDLEYEKFYGLKEGERILGWVGMKDKETGLEMTPAVDLHGSWRGQGGKVVITLMVPSRNEVSPIKTIKDAGHGAVQGFDAELTDGARVFYRAAPESTNLEADGLSAVAKSLLVVRHGKGGQSGMVLDATRFNGDKPAQPSFEFHQPPRRWWQFIKPEPRTIPIDAPTTFQWTGDGQNLKPIYRLVN